MKRWLGVHNYAVGIHRGNPEIDKVGLAESLASHYGLTKARSVYFADDFAIRFCYSNDAGFSNCVVSLATLKKFDDRPFLVCLLKPSEVLTFLANSTLVRKASHSSHKLALDKVRGTILGHDIIREIDDLRNEPQNFEALFETHSGFTWQENLERIVESTSAIAPTGIRFEPSSEERRQILNSPKVSENAERSGQIAKVEEQLLAQLEKNKARIFDLARVDNVNLRGNRIEQLLTGTGNVHLIADRIFELPDDLRIIVDIKTKLLGLSSSPKLYNIDKTLKELSRGSTALCLFMIGVDLEGRNLSGRLVDILDEQVINGTRIQFHWAGRNSRGVTQLALDARVFFEASFRGRIDLKKASAFLEQLLGG